MLVSLAALAACGSGTGYGSSTATTTPRAAATTAVGGATTAAAGGSGAATSAAATADTITIKGFAFTAPDVTPGATITVKNEDGTTHTVTSDDGSSFNVTVDGGGKATFTAPTKPGSYAFHCNIHHSMTGTLTVTG